MMRGEGTLVCNEIVPSRAAILSGNLERMGIRNALVVSADPQAPGANMAGSCLIPYIGGCALQRRGDVSPSSGNAFGMVRRYARTVRKTAASHSGKRGWTCSRPAGGCATPHAPSARKKTKASSALFYRRIRNFNRSILRFQTTTAKPCVRRSGCMRLYPHTMTRRRALRGAAYQRQILRHQKTEPAGPAAPGACVCRAGSARR